MAGQLLNFVCPDDMLQIIDLVAHKNNLDRAQAIKALINAGIVVLSVDEFLLPVAPDVKQPGELVGQDDLNERVRARILQQLKDAVLQLSKRVKPNLDE